MNRSKKKKEKEKEKEKEKKRKKKEKKVLYNVVHSLVLLPIYPRLMGRPSSLIIDVPCSSRSFTMQTIISPWIKRTPLFGSWPMLFLERTMLLWKLWAYGVCDPPCPLGTANCGHGRPIPVSIHSIADFCGRICGIGTTGVCANGSLSMSPRFRELSRRMCECKHNHSLYMCRFHVCTKPNMHLNRMCMY